VAVSALHLFNILRMGAQETKRNLFNKNAIFI